MTGAQFPASRARSRGFSLVELLVVVGIIAVLSAVSMPSIVAYLRSAKVRSAQNIVAGALQKARNTAIMQNSQMGISFVTENSGTFWIHVEDTVAGLTVGNVGFTRQGIVLGGPDTVLSTRYDLPQGVEFAANALDCPMVPGFVPNQASIRFDRYGVASLPGAGPVPTPTPLVISGGAAIPRIYVPAGTADLSICLIDRTQADRSRRVGMRWIRISRSGRILRP